MFDTTKFVFIIKEHSVFCDVRAESLRMMQIYLGIQGEKE